MQQPIGLQLLEREQVKELLRKKIATHIVLDKPYFQWTARITSGVK